MVSWIFGRIQDRTTPSSTEKNEIWSYEIENILQASPPVPRPSYPKITTYSQLATNQVASKTVPSVKRLELGLAIFQVDSKRIYHNPTRKNSFPLKTGFRLIKDTIHLYVEIASVV